MVFDKHDNLRANEDACDHVVIEELDDEINYVDEYEDRSGLVTKNKNCVYGNYFIATVLSNRAQVYLTLHDWPNAFLDAAASLTIRPFHSPKTWKRYHKAFHQMISRRDDKTLPLPQKKPHPQPSEQVLRSNSKKLKITHPKCRNNNRGSNRKYQTKEESDLLLLQYRNLFSYLLPYALTNQHCVDSDENCDSNKSSCPRRNYHCQNQCFGNHPCKDVEVKEELLILKQTNEAYLRNDFKGALDLFDVILQRETAKITKTLLYQWSHSAMRNSTLSDVLAASFAFLRMSYVGKNTRNGTCGCSSNSSEKLEIIFNLSKSLICLGEPRLSIQLMDHFHDISLKEKESLGKDNNYLSDLMIEAHHLLILLDTGMISDGKGLFLDPPTLLPDWIGNIETFQTATTEKPIINREDTNRGRGIRATTNIEKGEVVLIERPIISLSCSSIDEKRKSTKSIEDILVQRSKKDGLLYRMVDNLFDGKNDLPPLLPLQFLTVHFASTPLLLPSHHDYMNNDFNNHTSCIEDLSLSRLNLTYERVVRIMKTNSHGSGIQRVKKLEKNKTKHEVNDDLCGQNWKKAISDTTETTEQLFPAISIFNHCNKPSCIQLDIKSDSCVLAALHDIKQGEELTICYHPDEEVAKVQWGVC